MLSAGVNAKAGELIAAEAVLREHALDGELHRKLGALVHELLILNFLESADPAGVMTVILLRQLVAGEDGFLRVDDDDEIAAVNVGCVIDLVLSAQESGGLDGGPPNIIINKVSLFRCLKFISQGKAVVNTYFQKNQTVFLYLLFSLVFSKKLRFSQNSDKNLSPVFSALCHIAICFPYY